MCGRGSKLASLLLDCFVFDGMIIRRWIVEYAM